MTRIPTRLIIILGLFLSLVAGLRAAEQKSPATLEAAVLFQHPDIRATSLSPNGKYVAYMLKKDDDEYAFSYTNLETGEGGSISPGGGEIFYYEWVDDDRVYWLSKNNEGYRTYIYKLGGKNAEETNPMDYFSIIAMYRDKPGQALVHFADYPGAYHTGVAIVDFNKKLMAMPGQSKKLYNVIKWINLPDGQYYEMRTDQNGHARFACTYKDKKLRWHYMPKDDADWIELNMDGAVDAPEQASADGKTIYATHLGPNDSAAGLYAYDLASGEFTQCIYGDPTYSVEHADIRFDPETGAPTSLFYDRDIPKFVALTEESAKLQAEINAALPPGYINLPTQISKGNKKVFVLSKHSMAPNRCYIYDTQTHAVTALQSAYPWLEGYKFRPMQSVNFTSRDGIKLQGYLTMPEPREDGKKPALVVYVHGGPWARDTWGFDTEVQFYASRGYAVFQPNYRGSEGFNRQISFESNYKFKEMHDDVTDGVNALKKSGLIDPDRIAIIGGSFGGYLSLAGVTFEPDLYKCAASIVGVFDWKSMIRKRGYNFDHSYDYDQYVKNFGDPKQSSPILEAISPLYHVEKIKVPVFVSHGVDDNNVDVSQSRKLVAALKRNDVKVESFFAPLDGHGYFKTKNRVKYYEMVEKFFAKNL